MHHILHNYLVPVNTSYCHIIILLLWEFSYQHLLMVSIGVCVTASHLKSSGLLSVFRPIIIIILISEFFTPAIADGFLQEPEWQEISWSLLDSSQYSGRLLLLLLLLFTPLEFFTSVLADGFSQEFEWQQVSSSLQDSSQYSGRSL